MKITVFTSNQPRHRALVAALANLAETCHAVIECKTVHPGKVPGFYKQSETMQAYFSRVQEAENRIFGNVGFVQGVNVLPLQRGDLSMLSPEQLGEAMEADLFIVFGSSVINGKRFDWTEKDIFCVPSWAWHEHANGSDSEDAVLFCLNDLPVMRALGLYREEGFGDNGGNQPLV